jgi:hypothetical protein
MSDLMFVTVAVFFLCGFEKRFRIKLYYVMDN